MQNPTIQNMQKRTLYRRIGLLLFSIGILIGIAIYGGAVWADLEAFLFDSSLDADSSLSSLSCPVFMTTKETGIISAKISNDTDKPVERILRAHIAEGYVTLMREINSKLPIEPKSTAPIEWEIYPDDAVYGDRLILFRVYVFPNYPIPTSGAACGVLLFSSEIVSGAQLLWIMLTLSIVLVFGGRWLWHQGTQPITQLRMRNVASAMNWLSGFVLAGIIFSLLGLWGVSGLLLIVALLMIGVIFGRYAPTED
jgi:hypothetical protein